MVQRVMAGAFGGIMSDDLQRRTKAADVVLCVFGLGLGVGLVYYGSTADRYELVGSLRGIKKMIVISPAQYIVDMYGLDVCALSEYLDMYDRDAVSIMGEDPLTEEQAEKLEGLGRSKESWLAMDGDFQNARAAQ